MLPVNIADWQVKLLERANEFNLKKVRDARIISKKVSKKKVSFEKNDIFP